MVFDEVEVLDFAGPYEVFSRTRLVPGVESRRSNDSAPFEVITVAATAAPIRATGGPRVVPDFDFASAPPIDILVVPGGFGTRALLRDEVTLAWIRQTAATARRVTSVCTGALLLARVGLLAGRRATTHWGALTLLAEVTRPSGSSRTSGWSRTGSSRRPGCRRGSTWRWRWWSRCAVAPWPTRRRTTWIIPDMRPVSPAKS